MNTKKILLSFLAIVVTALFLCPTSSALDKPINWYCTRNKEHKQPIFSSDLRMVEKYGGYYIDKNHGDRDNDKVLYLTFDAGYENGNVEKILDTMKSENVVGAFFILKNLIIKNPELVKRMSEEGHTVCNHTSSHKDISKITSEEDFRKELEELENIYREYTGCEMAKYFRPPEGRFSEASMHMTQKLGYKTIFWSFAYADWDNNSQMSPNKAKAKILDNIHNGAVILLHPTSATNAAILGDIIKELKSQGYRFGTLEELTA